MKVIRIVFWLLITWQAASKGQAPSAASSPDESPGYGLTPNQEKALRERWIRAQPVVALFSGEAQTVAGQPIHVTDEAVLVYPRITLPAGGDWLKDLVAVPLSQIDSIALQKGGNRIMRAGRARAYHLQPVIPDAGESARQHLRKAAVYRDSLVEARDLEEAFNHSRVLRTVFPKKHIRISVGAGFGGDVVTGDVVEALRSSPLGVPEEGYGTTTSIEWADIAFRLMSRYMAGWQYVYMPDYSNLYSYYWDEVSSSSYNYRIELYEHRIYAEYGIFHVDRYFSGPVEWTVGAGIILARPEQYFYYQYSYHPDGDQYYDETLFDQASGRLTGLQLKSAFHIFFFPGLSLFAGLEACFYQKWIIPALALPASGTGGEIIFPEHEIGLNRFRFKAGISIYL